MRPAARRVQLIRRTLKPPHAPASERLCPRRFSFRHPRLLLATHHSYPRPQLPFLYPSGQYLANGRVLRLFSINATQRKFIKETAKLSVKYSIIIFCMTTCFSIASFGILSERQERAFPSPHEWSWITRVRFRRGKWWQVDENNEKEGFVNWARVYNELEPVLQRLEDPNKDGEGLVKPEDGAILVPGVGEAGLDITAKSEEWRQGYFEVLMGMAKGAEQMEGWVTRKGKRYIWSPEFVESPDNPRPRAVLPGRPEVPDVEERIPATEPPEKFYLKILTTTGFTSHQRISAALGYADWLNFKKLPESAEETYRWALDIAISGVSTSNPSTIINRETGILSVNAPKELITPNIVYTATNLATFFAEHDRVTEALPIFISVLRARISADPAPPYVKPTQDSSITGTLLSLLSEPDYPPVPPSGDETLLRDEKDRCEEAVLRNYIGEILFVTAGPSDNQRKQGLKWVRDGVSTAKIAQTLDPIRNDDDLRKKCEKCEEVGLESWGKIMSYLAHEAREKRDATKSITVTNLLWKLWGGTAKLDEAVENLEDEEGGVVMRLDKLRRKMRKDEFAEMDRKYARTFVF